MSAVYPDPNGPTPQPGIQAPARPSLLAMHPYAALGIGVLMAVLLFMMFSRKNANTSTQPAAQSSVNGIPASGDTSGLAKDANGNPIEFMPTQDNFVSYSSQTTSDSNNTTNSNNNTSTDTTTTTNNPPPTIPPIRGIFCRVGYHWDGTQCVPNTLPGPGPVPGPPPPPTPAPPPDNPPPQAHKTFKVTPWPTPGSSLWSIALIEYGNPFKWPQIYNANKQQIGSNPNLLKKDMILTIP